jgi:hypothetical protein
MSSYSSDLQASKSELLNVALNKQQINI